MSVYLSFFISHLSPLLSLPPHSLSLSPYTFLSLSIPLPISLFLPLSFSLSLFFSLSTSIFYLSMKIEHVRSNPFRKLNSSSFRLRLRGNKIVKRAKDKNVFFSSQIKKERGSERQIFSKNCKKSLFQKCFLKPN